MELRIVLALIAILFSILFIRFAINRNSSGLIGLDAVGAYILILLAGLTLTLIEFWALVFVQKLYKKHLSGKIEVWSLCMTLVVQWLIWSQLTALLIANL